ncbi:MAG: hypothetical protein QOI31_729 [Solirubrobacterales bacterium]|nr:hypothetical protein [Solirubrobacterales bacterium]
MRRFAAIATAALLAMAGQAAAAEIEVTGDEQTGLGAAIVAAEPDDIILIPAGNYYLTEGDVLEEKDLTLRGAGENLTTIIPTGGGDALLDEGVTVEQADTAEALEPSENEAASQEKDGSASEGIETKAQIIALVVTFAIFLFVLDLVRRRRLSERYAIIWMTAAFALLVLSIWTGGLDAIADLMGIQEPANAIFIIAFAVGFLLLLNFSVVSSRLSEESKVLAQEVARLEQELRHERSLRGGEENGFSGRAAADEKQDDPPVRAE